MNKRIQAVITQVLILFYSKRGIYYFMTNSESPFSQGLDTYVKRKLIKTTSTMPDPDSSQIGQNDISSTDS